MSKKRLFYSSALKRIAAIPAALSIMLLVMWGVAQAVQLPPENSVAFIQTTGPNGSPNKGDYYANFTTDQNHFVQIFVPPDFPPNETITFALYDPESNAAGQDTFNPPALDEIRADDPNADPLNRDDTNFRLVAPNGTTTIVDQTYTPDIGTNGSWVELATIAPGAFGGPGIYTLYISTSNDDEQAWRLSVSHDPDCTVSHDNNGLIGTGGTCTATLGDQASIQGLSGTFTNGNEQDDIDTTPGTGDELAVGVIQVSFQHAGAGTDISCEEFYFFIDGSVGSITLHNYDLDLGLTGNETVTYYSPAPRTIPGTPSGGTAWNNGTTGNPPTRVGDVIPVDVNDTGWWRADVCVGGDNQYVFEGVEGEPSFFEIPPTPEMTLSKDDGQTLVSAGDTLTYTIVFTNVSDQNTTPPPGAARNVTLLDVLPSNAQTLLSCTVNSPFTGTCTDNGDGTVDITINETVIAGASGSVTLAVSLDTGVTNGELVTNTVTLNYQDDLGHSYRPVEARDVDTVQLPPPDLTLTKSVQPAIAQAGGLLTYTLAYTNISSTAATGVIITETVPANTSFQGTPAGWSCAPDNSAGSICTYSVNDLAGSAGGTVQFVVQVNSSVSTAVTQIDNTARVSDDGSQGDDPTPDNNIDSASVPLVFPDLAIAKTDNGVTTQPGATVVYTLTYSNVSNVNATGVTITETVPANSSFNAAASDSGWSCTDTVAGSTCTFDIGPLNANASGQVLFALTVIDPLPADVTQISNTATIGGNEPDPTPGNNSASETTPVNAAPDMVIEKQDGGETFIFAGQTITYTLVYSNVGNQAATGVTITETVPNNTTFIGPNTWSCADVTAGSTCTQTIPGSVVPGTVGVLEFVVRLDNPLPTGLLVIENTASVGDDGLNGEDPTPENNTSRLNTPQNVVLPDLVIAKTDNGVTTQPGATLVYTLTYSNVTIAPATGVAISETVPANTTFNAAASDSGWSCADTVAGSTCTFDVGPLGGNSGGQVVFAVTVDEPLPSGVNEILNAATIGGNEPDPTPENNRATETTPVNATPDMVINKQDGGETSIAPNQVITYTLVYSNVGNQVATGVTITETVPTNTSFEGPNGWSCNGTAAGSTCTQLVGTVAPGSAPGTLEFVVRLDGQLPPGTLVIQNTARVGDDGTNGPDPTPQNNQDTLNTPQNVILPDLKLAKVANVAAAQPGETITYTLDYRNDGTGPATGVVISETVPANSTFVGPAGNGGWNCSGITPGSLCLFNVGTLAVNATGQAEFAITLDNPLPAGVVSVTNTAVIRGNEPEPPGDNSASVTTPINAAPDLVINKQDGGETSITGGQVVTYTLVYSNVGNQDATGVVITDAVPANTTFVGPSGAGNWSCAVDAVAGTACTFNVGDVAAGAPAQSVSYIVRVVDPLPTGQTFILNTVVIQDDGTNGPDPTPSNNDQTVDTPRGSIPPDLAITKVPNVSQTTPGGAIVYALNYENLTVVDATGVVITETVPNFTTFDAASSLPTVWSCADGSGPGVVCTTSLGTVRGNATGVEKFAVFVSNDAVTEIQNLARIADDGSKGADPTPENNVTAATVPLVIVPPPPPPPPPPPTPPPSSPGKSDDDDDDDNNSAVVASPPPAVPPAQPVVQPQPQQLPVMLLPETGLRSSVTPPVGASPGLRWGLFFTMSLSGAGLLLWLKRRRR